jgi:hypothetical protein
VGRDQDTCTVVAQSAHDRVQILPCGWIQAGRRLVQQQRAGMAEQRLGEAEPLAHALGVGADAAVSDSGQADAVQQFRNDAHRLALQARVKRQRLGPGHGRLESNVFG